MSPGLVFVKKKEWWDEMKAILNNIPQCKNASFVWLDTRQYSNLPKLHYAIQPRATLSGARIMSFKSTVI